MIIKIGEKLAELRNKKGLTQQALARALGITRSSVNAWEMGISHPSIEKIIDLAQFFHISTDYLLGINNSEYIDVSLLNEKEKIKLENNELILKDFSSNKCQEETTKKISKNKKKLKEVEDGNIKETSSTME